MTHPADESSPDIYRISPRPASGDPPIDVAADAAGPSSPFSTEGIQVLFRPLWGLADRSFETVWSAMPRDATLPRPDSGIRERLPDRSIGCVCPAIEEAVRCACEFRSWLRGRLQPSPGFHPLPLVILLFLQQNDTADGFPDDLKNGFHPDMIPGDIHVARSLGRSLADAPALVSIPSPDSHPPPPFYRLSEGSASPDVRPPLFWFRKALARGPHPTPCFYCGERRHHPARCPAKNKDIPEVGLNRLGYMPFTRINREFYRLLCDPDFPEAERISAEQALAEVNRPYHPAFIEKILRSEAADWETAVSADGRRTGGKIWLAYDCIRASNLPRALDIIEAERKNHPQDHRIHAALGLVSLEKNDFRNALRSFSRALGLARTLPHQVLYRLLLARLHFVEGKTGLADREIERALALEARCPEVRYEQVRLMLQRETPAEHLSLPGDMVRGDRTCFVRMLIDPALAPSDALVSEMLDRIYIGTWESAGRAVTDARGELDRLKHLSGEDAARLEPVLTAWDTIENLSGSDSYFGHLDRLSRSGALIRTCRDLIADARKNILNRFFEIGRRMNGCVSVLENFPREASVFKIYEEIQTLGREMEGVKNRLREETPGIFSEAPREADRFSSRLEDIHFEIILLGKFFQVRHFLAVFLRLSLIIQSLNLLFGIILFPLISHLLMLKFPELNIPTGYIEFYIKGFLVTGGICGAILALVITAHRQFSKKRSSSG